ncbi:GNAT family N-acetyltransferase [Paracoccus aminophilus]|uniref:GCN5-like N-acetyltransferase n=1 Tax=Paracoccus aminophilus JCM 7686 TaxID=1367847 RepID=S5XT89_PARAH|nr:N-acetyltransferase [Paracoccus aminophilus]AGT10699.1 GCN5-like N-acetyltransferase [Paracoccus aminophilus JCM 7686]
MPDPFLITPARPEDADALARIYLEARREIMPKAAPDSFTLEDFAQDSAGEVVLVARGAGGPENGAKNRGVLGFLSLWAADHFIHMLYLDKAARGRGIGAALLQALPDWPNQPYRLKCLVENQRARHFYVAKGFAVLREATSSEGDYVEMELRPAR